MKKEGLGSSNEKVSKVSNAWIDPCKDVITFENCTAPLSTFRKTASSLFMWCRCLVRTSLIVSYLDCSWSSQHLIIIIIKKIDFVQPTYADCLKTRCLGPFDNHSCSASVGYLNCAITGITPFVKYTYTIRMYVGMHACVRVFVHQWMDVYVCMHLCTYRYAYVCMYLCMHACT